ncbi:MAG: ferredoxin [Alphaproteobacteria bacterium]|nr:ferredoxin [Alphaproteobacteria bacterium]
MKILVTDKDGQEHTLEGTKDWSVMEVIRDGGLEMLAQCGGSCACATCHVYVDEAWISKIPEPTEEEIGMLDGAFNVNDQSRLSCQLFCTDEADGLKVTIAPGSY